MSPEERSLDLSRVGRAAVVGGSGFIGLNLCRHLAAAGVDVSCIDPRPPRQEVFEGKQVHHESKLTPDSLSGASVVFHVAGSTEPASSNTHLRADMAGTVGLTLDLLEASRVANVERVVHVSSGGTVYGPGAPIPTPETAKTDPLCAYGISKLAAEGHVHLSERLHGILGFNLRVANPYGPWQDPLRGQGAVNAFLYRAMRNESIELWGDGEIIRDFLYIDDVVMAACSAAVYGGEERVFNIGSGQGLSVAQLITDIESVVGMPIQVDRKPSRDADVPRSVLDIDRAKQVLDWHPQVPWLEGLRKTMNWMKQHVLTGAEAP